MLLQLPEDKLTEESRNRLARYYEQDLVKIETLRRNKGVPPALQLKVAEQVAAEPDRWAAALNWGGPFPTTEHVKELGELLITLTGTSNWGPLRQAARS